jgi:uncharacterized damage-inducible protein DinB
MPPMKVITIVLLAGALYQSPPSPPEFKASSDPTSDAVRQQLASQSKNLVASAELLPAEKYGYQPTPAQMTFAKLIAHIAQTNLALCSAISGTSSPLTPDQLQKLSDTAAKDALVAAIKGSFDYCTEGLAKVTDSQLGDEVTMFGRRTGMTRAAATIVLVADWADHYSTAASYLRLNGILPPTAQGKK